MTGASTAGRVLVPVADQDAAITFYTEKLGYTLTADVPLGGGARWVEVCPPGGGTAIALVPPRGEYQPEGECQPEVMGAGGGVPVLFYFRQGDRDQLMTVREQ